MEVILTLAGFNAGTLSWSNWNLKCWSYRGRKTGAHGEKHSRQNDNQRQTQPTLDTGQNRTQATLVGSERSDYCAIPAKR